MVERHGAHVVPDYVYILVQIRCNKNMRFASRIPRFLKTGLAAAIEQTGFCPFMQVEKEKNPCATYA